MNLITTSQIAPKWGVSQRRVAVLCERGRVSGVKKIGNTWLIPENAKKPTDSRIKSGKYIKSKNEETDNGCSN